MPASTGTTSTGTNPTGASLFDTVLVANRGEIACRVFRTLRRLGIRSVAVYSDADADARHVREADVAVRIGPASARMSYLDVDAVLAAAAATGAQAIHPGYGFLSENPALARACEVAGIVFVGPSVHALEVMGDKIRAKECASAQGVAVIPGSGGAGWSDERLVQAASGVGYPLLVKPAAGGGGTGMRVVAAARELADAIVAARRIALSAFGDDTLLLERRISAPRHIEVQVLADTHGTVLSLGERECSLQRRHQKVIEEAPSPLIDPAMRLRMGDAARLVARSVGYTGAGTVEFLVSADAPDEFFFLEMNARLQVEHPVTELVTGIDLVEHQLRVAAGERLALDPAAIKTPSGHAIEARVYAEDPARDFLPSAGRVLALVEPGGEGVRVDSSLRAGQEVTSDYDPMLAKVIAWGATRDEAIARLDAALASTVVLGVATNIEYLRLLLADPDVRAGRLDTALIERRLPQLRFRAPDTPLVVAAALVLHAERWNAAATLWQRPTGWRIGEHRPVRYCLGAAGLPDGSVDALVSGTPDVATVTIDDAEHEAGIRDLGNGEHLVRLDGIASRWTCARAGADIWLGQGGFGCRLTIRDRAVEVADALAARSGASGTTGTSGANGPAGPEVRSPMPGTVVAVDAETGDDVPAGAALVTVEAMKMEHRLLAPVPGIATLLVRLGDRVRLDQIVATVATTSSADSKETPWVTN